MSLQRDSVTEADLKEKMDGGKTVVKVVDRFEDMLVRTKGRNTG